VSLILGKDKIELHKVIDSFNTFLFSYNDFYSKLSPMLKQRIEYNTFCKIMKYNGFTRITFSRNSYFYNKEKIRDNQSIVRLNKILYHKIGYNRLVNLKKRRVNNE
jgi:hypothetical protein